jgi:transcription elongation factor GreA
MRIPTRKSEIWRNAKQTDDHFFTPAALERMKADLERLTKKERGTAAEEVHRTKQMGDLSENAGYQEAKATLRRINDRITTLEARIKHAVVIEKGEQDGKIRIGSTVTLYVNGKQTTFTILGSHETSPGKGRISHLSPLGKLLLGRHEGEQVTLHLDGRAIEYGIVKVE